MINELNMRNMQENIKSKNIPEKRIVLKVSNETREKLIKCKTSKMRTYDLVIDYLIKQELNNRTLKKLD